MPSLSQLGQGWTLAVPSEVVSGKAVNTPPKIAADKHLGFIFILIKMLQANITLE